MLDSSSDRPDAVKRVLIIGCGGAGKSYVATELGRATGISVIHLDRLYWKPGWQEPSNAEWDRIVRAAVAGDRWIMDGNYGGTLALRLARADTVIFLDFPRRRCLARVLKRRVGSLWQARPDMADGCPERLNWEFVRWILEFRKQTRPKIMTALRDGGSAKRVYVVTSNAQSRALLKRWTGHGAA